LTCVTCHAAHGNAAYRNLVASPSGTGRSASAPSVAQLVTADGTNAAAVYVRSNVRYVSGMSQWCMDCHDGITSAHSDSVDGPPHPWDRPMFGSPSADWIAWSGPVANRVPVQNALGLAAPTPNEGDQVFCLSCHKAHGSPNHAALIHADGTTLSSTCQQCHNQ
jgi:predicted CXXCH cytochrome family protein